MAIENVRRQPWRLWLSVPRHPALADGAAVAGQDAERAPAHPAIRLAASVACFGWPRAPGAQIELAVEIEGKICGG